MSNTNLSITVPLVGTPPSSPVSSKSPDSPKVGFKPSPLPTTSKTTLSGRVCNALLNPKTVTGAIAITLIALGALGFAGFITTATFPALPILLTVLGGVALMIYIGSLNNSSSSTYFSDFSIKSTAYPGLSNPSNNCFANSALKLIVTNYTSEQLGETLIQREHEADQTFAQRESLQALLVLFKNAYDANNQPEINDFKTQILAHPLLRKYDRGTRQNDSAEFVQDILNHLDRNTSPQTAVSVARGLLIEGTFIPDEGDPAENTSLVRLSSSIVSGSRSIQELIQDYVDLEDDPAQKADGQRRRLAADHPEFLTQISFQLPKTNLGGRKTALEITHLFDPITVPIHSGTEQVDVRFEPKSIIVHQGPTIRSGHYYALVKDGDNWFKHNDSRVTRATDEEVERAQREAAANGYVVTYSRIR
jgi:hypothetical protein